MTYQKINENKSIELLPDEIFKDIPDYEGLYQVSNLGRIKSLSKKAGCSNRKERVLKYTKDRNGYLFFGLCKNDIHKNYGVHRLVLLAFKGKSDLQVNHINGIKTDNRLENLEYCTAKENTAHAIRIGLMQNSLQNNINNRKKVKQFDKQGNFIKEYESIIQASIIIGISKSNICQCIQNKKGYKSAGGYIWKKV